MRTKICSICKKEKPFNKFYRHISSKPNGVRKQCNDCRKIYRKKAHKDNPKIKRRQARNWVNKNRDKVNEEARRRRSENRKRYKGYTLKRDFGITLIQYEKMLNEQGGLCKLCNRPETAKHQSGHTKELAVDHDHVTKNIRGLLCWVCNTGIGKLQDDPVLLRKAANYIEKHRKTK
jgi:hypothetical protein